MPTDSAPTIDHDGAVPIRAAGCLVYRHRDGDGRLEVLIAHRPRYDDWDLPKGKREPGEDDLACALREVEEETGYVGEVGPELATDRYTVKGRPKQVRWWLLRCTGGEFVPNDEVDAIQWLPVERARQVLSYDHPRRLLDALPDPD